LLARQLGIRTGLSWREMLHRSGNLHQVGASRAARLHQLGDDVFRVRATAYVEGCHVILIDDVMTTGGTVEAAAKVLRAAGARQVDVMVFAVA
jgi:predicted amidophosphoribosyltransferase